MLSHWVCGHGQGDQYYLPLGFVAKKLTQDGARLFGMYDRGNLEPGIKAEINLIDFNRLELNHPEMVNDLPAGMPRLMQTATGYVATFVSGEAVQQNGRETGARPGKAVRRPSRTASA